MTITDTITKTQDKVADAVEKGQTKVTDAVDNVFGENPADLTNLQQKMVDGVRKNTERMPNIAVPSKLSERMTSSKLLTPSEVVDRSFDFAGKVLENQRSFISALIDAGTKPESSSDTTDVEDVLEAASKKAKKAAKKEA